MLLRNASITRKLTLLCLAFGLMPLLVSGAICFAITRQIDAAATVVLETAAANIADKIDRNLFERYGDVQAFALNAVIDDRSSWYQRDGEHNQIAQLMNQYIDRYDVYAYSVLVDLDGKPIAVSFKDHAGKSLDTGFLYDRNYKHHDWFQACSQGQFTTQTKFTSAGNDQANGSFIRDVHIDADCAQIMPQEHGLAMSFAAPVYRDGKVIAYWNNVVRFALVEGIAKDEYRSLKAQGHLEAELTIVNADGSVLLDFDPTRTGIEEPNHDFKNVILKLNLAEAGVGSVQEVITGQRGSHYSVHSRKLTKQGCGYAPLTGAMGYPGMPWGVLVRVPEEVFCAQGTATARTAILLTAAVSAVVIAVLGVLIGRRTLIPLFKSAKLPNGWPPVISPKNSPIAVEMKSGSWQMSFGRSLPPCGDSVRKPSIWSIARRTETSSNGAMPVSSKAAMQISSWA